MKKIIYNITICVLAVISVVFAIIDFTKGLNQTLAVIDKIIYIIFFLDYVIRLVLADSKKDFFKHNVFDLIAIIPFNSAFRFFRALRILRFSKLLKLTKLFRVATFSARLLSKAKRFLNTNGFKYVLCLSGVSILVASFAMMYFEGMTFPDALWWSFVTATTVGYGDLSPASSAGRVIASLLMLVGIGLIGSLTSSITSFFLVSDVEQEPVPFSSDKVEMVATLYDKLSEEEKEAFKHRIN